MIIAIQFFLILLGTYFLIGFVFAFYFLIHGAPKIDPLMRETEKKVRFLLFPGILATWPLLIRKIINNKKR